MENKKNTMESLKHQRRHIPAEIIPIAYKVARKVYDGKLRMSDGVKELVGENLMNKNSARDYLTDFKCLMEGKRFTRTLNYDSMEYFFNKISLDYRSSQLAIALSSLQKHIDYYEGKQHSTMHQMRVIYKKYLPKSQPLELIGSDDELMQNIEAFEGYLTEGNETEKAQALSLLKRGTCFVAYQVREELRFAPSRFIGYVKNSLERHQTSDIDGRQTNRVITSILKTNLSREAKLETAYGEYCRNLGVDTNAKGTFGVQRKYWFIVAPECFAKSDEISDFPEGAIKERIHKSKERNSTLMSVAKGAFKLKHGRIFCQVCGFDFETNYGKVGMDFIEGHHTIPVESMPPDYKTKPEEIAMLCANCHRMVHRKRPWLSMAELTTLTAR